jgi:hypothetical protein
MLSARIRSEVGPHTKEESSRWNLDLPLYLESLIHGVFGHDDVLYGVITQLALHVHGVSIALVVKDALFLLLSLLLLLKKFTLHTAAEFVNLNGSFEGILHSGSALSTTHACQS